MGKLCNNSRIIGEGERGDRKGQDWLGNYAKRKKEIEAWYDSLR